MINEYIRLGTIFVLGIVLASLLGEHLSELIVKEQDTTKAEVMTVCCSLVFIIVWGLIFNKVIL